MPERAGLASADETRGRIRSVALISSIALSVPNFRGPLIRAMVAEGVRVYALAPDYDENIREAVRRLGAEPIDFTLERTGIKPLRDMVDTVRLIRLLHRLKPDATFSYFIKPVIYGSLAAAAAGVRRRFSLVAGLGYVFTPDGRQETRRRKVLRWLVTALYRQAFRVSERVFFQNDDDIAHFVDAGLLDRQKAVRTNGTGVDLEQLLPAPAFEHPVTFLLMARLLREKGIVEFVEAARAVKKIHPDVQFVILGAHDPNPGALSSDEVARWVDEGVVQWHGHVDDVRPWLARSSVYVLPSYREGTPRSTQEAMAMARPVITTDAVGCRETVIDGVNGFLVPVRDSEALAASMLRFIDDRSLLASMGAASRRLAETRFDVTKVNAKILATMGIAPEPLTASASSGLVALAPSARLELS